jgi:hypothetical protein
MNLRKQVPSLSQALALKTVIAHPPAVVPRPVSVTPAPSLRALVEEDVVGRPLPPK